MSELTERDLEAAAAVAVTVAEVEEEEEDSDYDEEEGMGLELASGAIKVNVWKQGRKVSNSAASRTVDAVYASAKAVTLCRTRCKSNYTLSYARAKAVILGLTHVQKQLHPLFAHTA